MKREELEVKDFLTHPLCEVKEHYYRKSDADKVMDAMEARIKELEDSYKYFKSQNGFHIQQSNELAESCRDKNKLIETLLQRIDELESSQPKWISVDDRLPKECEAVVCLVDKWEEMSVCWIEYMYEDKRWTDGDRDYPMDYYTHWMPIPQPPKSED